MVIELTEHYLLPVEYDCLLCLHVKLQKNKSQLITAYDGTNDWFWPAKTRCNWLALQYWLQGKRVLALYQTLDSRRLPMWLSARSIIPLMGHTFWSACLQDVGIVPSKIVSPEDHCLHIYQCWRHLKDINSPTIQNMQFIY